jgi:CheY-like chemotaxis protein
MKLILVIDDEPEVLDIVRSIIKTRGHDTLVTASGAEGIRLAREENPDLIICDLMMPEVSGIQVIKAIKGDPTTASIPFMVLSPVEPDEEKTEEYWATGLGVDEYMAKPFDPLDLLGRVEYLLRRSQYASHRRQKGAAPAVAQAAPEPPMPPRVATPEEIRAAAPAELVRIYNECWNQRDWQTEYACLTDETTQWVPFDQYAAGRETAWNEAGGTRQKLVRVEKESIEEDSAEVICEREDTFDGRTWKKRITFELKRGDAGWRVRRTREEALRHDLPRIKD